MRSLSRSLNAHSCTYCWYSVLARSQALWGKNNQRRACCLQAGPIYNQANGALSMSDAFLHSLGLSDCDSFYLCISMIGYCRFKCFSCLGFKHTIGQTYKTSLLVFQHKWLMKKLFLPILKTVHAPVCNVLNILW